MNIKTTLILATTAVALLSAPASARIDGDDGGPSAYPTFNGARDYYSNGAASAYASGVVVRPRKGARQPQRPRHSQSRW
jgi:hypothetical protein